MLRYLNAAVFLTLFCLLGVLPEIADSNAAAPRASLYQRLGGEPVVTAVANELIDAVSADPHMNQSFAKVDLKRVKRLLAEQICSLTGGGCTYTGDSMAEVHAGHNIRDAEFFGLVEKMRVIMIRNGIALRERNELLAILAPMKRDVVTRS